MGVFKGGILTIFINVFVAKQCPKNSFKNISKKFFIIFSVSSTVDSFSQKFTTEALGTTPVECINSRSTHSIEREIFSLLLSKNVKKFFDYL